MTRNPPLSSFDELVDMIVLDEDKPTHTLLCKWTAAYPQFSQELSDLFVTWADQAELADDQRLEKAAKQSPFASRAVSHALNILHQEQMREQALALERSPGDAARLAGKSGSELAQELDLDEVLLMKLDRRRFPFESLPPLLFERLAKALPPFIDQITTFFQGQPRPAAAGMRLRSRSRAKATLPTETFADALEKSSLDESKKAVWRRSLQSMHGERHR